MYVVYVGVCVFSPFVIYIYIYDVLHSIYIVLCHHLLGFATINLAN